MAELYCEVTIGYNPRFDPSVGKYVIYVRRDLGIAGRNCSGILSHGR